MTCSSATKALLRGTADVEGFYLRYCVPKKIELNRQYAARAGLVQDLWIILQTLCPYWLGLLALYATVLSAGLCLACLLRFDFQLNTGGCGEIVRALPWLIVPQMVLRFWRGQFRGLMSYFSLPELRQTGAALGLALLIQFLESLLLPRGFLPDRSVLILDFILSLAGVCAVRVFFRTHEENVIPALGRRCGNSSWRSPSSARERTRPGSRWNCGRVTGPPARWWPSLMTIRAPGTSGGTIFPWSGCRSACSMRNGETGLMKWIVALSDENPGRLLEIACLLKRICR